MTLPLQCPLLIGSRGDTQDVSSRCITTRCRLWNATLSECSFRKIIIDNVTISSGSFYVQLEANPPEAETPDSVRVFDYDGSQGLTIRSIPAIDRTWTLASGSDSLMVGQMPAISIQGIPPTIQGAIPAEEIWDNRADVVFTYTGSNITQIEKTLPSGKKQTKSLTYDGSNNLINYTITYT